MLIINYMFASMYNVITCIMSQHNDRLHVYLVLHLEVLLVSHQYTVAWWMTNHMAWMISLKLVSFKYSVISSACHMALVSEQSNVPLVRLYLMIW